VHEASRVRDDARITMRDDGVPMTIVYGAPYAATKHAPPSFTSATAISSITVRTGT